MQSKVEKIREQSKKKKKWNTGHRIDVRILRGQFRRASIRILGILEKESREKEGKEFVIEIMGKVPQIQRYEVAD